MASNLKRWRRKHADELKIAEEAGLEFISYCGQLSYACNVCGEWWPANDGPGHRCKGGENSAE